MIDDIRPSSPKYSQVLCIGLGLSGIGLGAQLKRQYGFKDMHFYDKNETYSGTWWVNHYPGAACDIPAIFYSYSFEQNQNWTRRLPTYDEIRGYIDGVVKKYQLREHMTFNTECESAEWDSTRHVWMVHLLDLITGKRYTHECQVLFSAIGLLSNPRIPEIPGMDTFEGPVFHTANWRDGVDFADKHTIVVGNGCSASQAVPRLVLETKTLTQFIKTPHWLVEMDNVAYGPITRWMLRNVPLLGRLIRLLTFLYCESTWNQFKLTESGARSRRNAEKTSKKYILQEAPKKYHHMIIPDWEFGCRRRVYDADSSYLRSLHAPNMELVQDTIIEVLPGAVRTETKTYPADIIVLATGFITDKGLSTLRVRGRDGEWLEEHWKNLGGPTAYHTTSVHGFPNFFILYGPNSNTGHTSVIMTTENVINCALKVLAPILKGEALEVEVTDEAEKMWVRNVQAASKGRVYNTCANWYTTKDGWNGTMYPWSQVYLWWRSVFPKWRDWKYTLK